MSRNAGGGRNSDRAGKKGHTTEKGRAVKDEREVVLLALLSHEKNDTFSNVLVRRTLDACADLSAGERAFIKRLLEGVIERKTELDARIEKYTGRSVSRLHPAVHQVLRMGLYQILYMDAVPDSAACNESVRLAKKHGPARLAGFVNGVLRNAARDAQKDAKNGEELLQGKASVQYSMPDWLVDMWTDQLGAEETERLLKAMLQIRPVTIRLRSGLSAQECDAVRDGLRSAGVLVEEGRWLENALRLRRTSDLRRLPGFAEGLWTVQDESSMLAVMAAGLRGTETVYDVCAAPGGKSFYAADLLRRGAGHRTASGTDSGTDPGINPGRQGIVYSFDLTRRKTDRIREGAKRMKLENLQVAERDARTIRPGEEASADVLLCDLPCSGLGVMGKKRDIKYRASREGILSLQTLQREILAASVQCLRPGGTLLYSTCTISREENEDNAAWIVSELGLKPVDLAPFLPEDLPGIRGNMLQLLPHVHGTDGFFIARFQKAP